VVVAVPLEDLLEVGLAVAAVDEPLLVGAAGRRGWRGCGPSPARPVLEDRERVVLDDDLGGGALDPGGGRGEAGPGGLAALLGGDAGLDLGALGQEAVEPLGLLGGEGGVAGLGVDGAQLAVRWRRGAPGALRESRGVLSGQDRVDECPPLVRQVSAEWRVAGSSSVVRAASTGSEVV
jgi:hypothetical protein